MNPYQSPTVESSFSTGIDSRDVYRRIGHCVVLWEKLRFVYTLVLLIAIVLAVVSRPVGGGVDFWSEVILGILVANIAYCLGPLVDGYLNWFGLRLKWMTIVLFGCGTALSAAVTFFETFYYGAILK